MTSSSAASGADNTGNDPYLWLEEVEGDEALAWVRARNAATLKDFESDPRFDSMRTAAEEIVTGKDRIPYGEYRGGYVYNFWQDDVHVRGLLRRTSLNSYKSGTPEWETILDIDELAKAEDENWVFKGWTGLPPSYERCLITLSRGGKDASVHREFDIKTRSFLEDGFFLPEAKAGAHWIDQDTLLVGTDWGEGSLTSSGYPRIVKIWKRGAPLEDAKTVVTGETGDVGVWPAVIHRKEGALVMVFRSVSFFEYEYYVIKPDGTSVRLPVPRTARLEEIFADQFIFQLYADWTPDGSDTALTKGMLASFDIAAFQKTGALPPVKTIVVPDERTAIQSVSVSQDVLLIDVLRNVTSVLLAATYDAQTGWSRREAPVPPHGAASVSSADPFNSVVFVSYQNFLTPDTLFHLDTKTLEMTPIKTAPTRFDASGLVVHQLEAVSKDGTRVPYFIVHRDDMVFDGSNPVHLYAYGGFRISMEPFYWATAGKLWLERGGVVAIANIRGGGEFGPRWHEAALKTKRQRAYDDFIAVSEDMIARKITAADKLGISGGSNGGLLMGVAFTQRPDLYKAVVCAVPLLDMLRFHKLLAGASWIGEYGNPDDGEEGRALRAYSPYHNLNKEADYPRVFFVTSTKDDRVHPGHARKMAARMEEQGHPYYYYENIEGGHSASANLLQLAHRTALQYVYLSRMLMD